MTQFRGLTITTTITIQSKEEKPKLKHKQNDLIQKKKRNITQNDCTRKFE